MKFTARFRNLLVAAVLATTVAPLTGCAVGTVDDVDAVEEIGATEQALEMPKIGPGEVFAGLNAAKEIYTMIDAYQRTGKLLALVDVYEKVTEVESEVKALRQQVSTLQNSMLELEGEISVSAARTVLATVDAVMAGWVDANESTDPSALAKFYSNVYNRTGVYGELDLATLQALDAHAQTAIVANGDFLATQPIGRVNELGVYAAGVRLRLTEGFFVLMLASQSQDAGNQAFFPGGNQVVAQADRLATFDETFFIANDDMNKAIVAKEMAWRGTMIEECNLGTDQTVYFKDWGPGSHAEFPYDQKLSWTSVGSGFFIRNYSNEDALMSHCGTFRASYVPQQQALYGSQKMGELLTVETAFSNWSTASDAAGATSTIHVEQAFYGSTQLPYRDSDVTAHLRSACDNRGTCDYTVDVNELGDIEFGAKKDFWLTYRCGASTATKKLYLAAEANGQTVTLDCNP